MKKILLLFIIFYFLILIQTTFLFKVFLPNLVLISVIIINLIEEKNKLSGIYFAFFGSLLLDIFSENFFGYYTLISTTIAIFITYGIKNYVRIPHFKKF